MRRQLLLEGQLQLCAALGIATASRMPRRALVSADKYVLLKLRHIPNLPAMAGWLDTAGQPPEGRGIEHAP